LFDVSLNLEKALGHEIHKKHEKFQRYTFKKNQLEREESVRAEHAEA